MILASIGRIRPKMATIMQIARIVQFGTMREPRAGQSAAGQPT
jgi:hypothetical protein